MRSLSDVVRFFIVVPPVSRMMTATFAVVVVVDAAFLVMEPTLGPRSMRPVLLLQAFAAASGFTVPARRGHYDLLLTLGHRRAVVAGVQFAMSAAPGAASWVALSVVEILVAPQDRLTVPTVGTAASLLVVSAVAWALTAPLPRFAGAVGWLLVLAVGTMLPIEGFERDVARSPMGEWAWHASRALIAPELMVGASWADRAALNGLPAVLIACSWLAIAIYRIEREDFRLDAGQ